MNSRFKCPYCTVNKFSVGKFIRHLQLAHQQNPNFSIRCGLHHCPSQFRLVESWRRHIYRKHRDILGTSTYLDSGNVDVNNDDSSGENDEYVIDSAQKQSGTNHNDLVMPAAETVSVIQKHLALFMLKLQEKHCLPKNVRGAMVDDLQFVFRYFTASMCDTLRSELSAAGISVDSNENLRQLLFMDTSVCMAFNDISSEYRLNQFCKQNLGLVEPQEHILGFNAKGKKETFQYIPLPALLKFLLSQSELRENIAKQQEVLRNDNFLTDYSDGMLSKQHPFLCKKRDCLTLHLYNDEFEVVNPLGSKKGRHKVSAFYFFIGSLAPKYHSQLRHIYLVLMVRYQFQQKYGYAEILKPVISHLNELASTGVTVYVDGKELTYHAILATVSCDNLTAHALAGFSSCFNSGRICRQCMAHYSEIQEKFSESDFVIRSPEIHKCHLEKIRMNPSDTGTYGVLRDCPFSALDYFCTVTSFPPDLMHDILEGVIPLVLKFTILHLHSAGILTITHINNELELFKFGQNDCKSQPAKIPSNFHRGDMTLPGKASEKLCIFRCLPFLIGCSIPVDDEVWKLYLDAREIVEILLSPVIPNSSLCYVEALIESFLSQFASKFPGKMTPKMHFLVHYPRLISDYGPLRALWCMRFESKHQYFKHIANGQNNFRNICRTFADRHQSKQCWEFTSLDLLHQDEESSGWSPVLLSSLPTCVKEALCKFFTDSMMDAIDPDEVVYKAKTLRADCVTYKVHDFFILTTVHEDFLVFCKIVCIIKIKASWVLCAKLCFPKLFKRHLWAYNLDVADDIIVLQPGMEEDYHALDSYVMDDGEEYITLHHRVWAMKTSSC